MANREHKIYKWYLEVIGLILGFTYFYIGVGVMFRDSIIGNLYPDEPMSIYVNISIAIFTALCAVSLIYKICHNILHEGVEAKIPVKNRALYSKTSKVVSAPFTPKHRMKVLIIMAGIIVGLFIYWVAFRPYFVRKSCAQEATEFATDHPRRGQDRMLTYGLKYEVCKSQHGVGD